MDARRETSSLRVNKIAPERVAAGESFTYEIRVTNDAQTPVGVVLTESLLSVLTIEGAVPASQLEEAHAGRWTLGPIYPGQSERVAIRCRSKTRLRFRSHTQISFAQES